MMLCDISNLPFILSSLKESKKILMRHQDLVILTSIHGISFERIDKNHEKYQNFFILKEENHQSIMISLMELRMTVMEDEGSIISDIGIHQSIGLSSMEFMTFVKEDEDSRIAHLLFHRSIKFSRLEMKIFKIEDKDSRLMEVGIFHSIYIPGNGSERGKNSSKILFDFFILHRVSRLDFNS